MKRSNLKALYVFIKKVHMNVIYVFINDNLKSYIHI
jgi:hypothetical protein